jgi:recombination protein RecR
MEAMPTAKNAVLFASIQRLRLADERHKIYKKNKSYELIVTRISRGIDVGSELQYADELTLGRSLQQRQIFELQ